MIRQSPADEPKSFDARCRKRGKAWLQNQANESSRPRDYWSEFRPDLEKAFKGLCGYQALHLFSGGSVDHFEPTSSHPQLAYEWTNFRYCDKGINSRKGNLGGETVLDPFDAHEDWFEILLPSLQMRLTQAVPEQYRVIAESTLRVLGLDHHETVIRARAAFYQAWVDGDVTLPGLRRLAPLIARAVESNRWTD